MTERILIIDNEQEVLVLLQMLLEHNGYKADTAKDGEEGISLFDKGHYDLIITDIEMPKRDGNSVVKYVRCSSMPEIPVIAITAGPFPENNDFDLLLRKPFEIKKLINAVKKLLNCEKRGRATQ